ncbi:hypothetical protein ABZP36_020978 [Zizania latifolia]
MAFAGILSDCTTVLFFLVLLLGASRLYPVGASHNITTILSTNQDFSEFSAALNSSNLTAEIDRRTTITVLAVDNGVMAQLRSRRLSPEAAVHSLALHVLLDYFDDAKLHSLTAGSALATSLFQATGQAKESSGIVNITVRLGGRVAFSPYGTPEASPAVFYQKSILESPYDIAVLQVSALISFPMAEAETPAPAPESAHGLADLLSKNGCDGFASLVTATAGAARTYQRSADGGLTVFCPADKSVAAFTSRFKNLTAEAQLVLLLYHGVAKHYSENVLKTINGEVNTLATDGTKSFDLTIMNDGDAVKLSSSSSGSEARVTKTITDDDRIAVYLIDAVLLPGELFNGSAGAVAVAPSPSPVTSPAPPPAPATKSAPSPKSKPAPTSEPAPAPDSPRADQRNNAASGMASWSLFAAPVAVALVLWGEWHLCG